jgi:hypothetical protein
MAQSHGYNEMQRETEQGFWIFKSQIIRKGQYHDAHTIQKLKSRIPLGAMDRRTSLGSIGMDRFLFTRGQANNRKNHIRERGNTMTMVNFIKENKAELDSAIKRVVPNASLNNEERRLWILNDEGLYRWARSQGVRI